MWSISKSEVMTGFRCKVQRGENFISVSEFLESLREDEGFREFWINAIQGFSFEAYRWETPGYTQATLDQDFQFVVLDAPSLNRDPNSSAFENFISDSSEAVESFQNLGKDAHLIVPSNLSTEANYCHLASFAKTAPLSQQHLLWSTVGRVGIELASTSPLWLSTAGGGVAWLHVRLDSSPKYYHYADFRKSPDQ